MKKEKIVLELKKTSSKRLHHLCDVTESSSRSAVIRQSLQVYEYLIEQVQSGKKFFIGNNVETAIEVKLFNVSD